MTRPLGYHISGGHQIGTSLLSTVGDGWSAAQIFLGPPQRFEITKIPQDQIELFKQVKEQSGIKVFVHAPYVLHVFAKPENVSKNNGFLRKLVDLSLELGIDGFVIHMGGTKWYEDLGADNRQTYLTVAKTLMESVGSHSMPILFENCASGNIWSGNLNTISWLIDELNKLGHNVGLCADTLHMWAWGYNLADVQMLNDINYAGVFRHLKLLHFNSGPEKAKCGSKFDRHECVSKGCIPLDALEHVLKIASSTPVIIEGHNHSDILEDARFVKDVDSSVSVV